MIYDDEGDCDPYYKVRFVFDRNLDFANAFHPQVEEVTLYVVDDNTGKIVMTRHESGDELKTNSYLMDVNVAPGNYSLVAWCGPGHRSTFSVAQSDVHTGLQCRLTARSTDAATGETVVKDFLPHLFHGKLMNQEFPDHQGVHIYTVELTRNTNDINVQMVQTALPIEIDPRDYTITISDDNGAMDWDNSLLNDDMLTYRPWHQEAGYIETEGDDDNPTGTVIPKGMTTVKASRADAASDGTINYPAVFADFTTARLMKNHTVRLYISHKDHGRIFSMPLVKYFLQSKGKYHNMEHQEYLDRQASFNVLVYMQGNTVSKVFVNNWKVVFQHWDGE